jgi:hypothetical protein
MGEGEYLTLLILVSFGEARICYWRALRIWVPAAGIFSAVSFHGEDFPIW